MTKMIQETIDMDEEGEEVQFVEDSAFPKVSSSKLSSVLEGNSQKDDEILQKKEFASEILKIKEVIQKSLVKDTNHLFSTADISLQETMLNKRDSLDQVIHSCLNLLKNFLEADFIAYASTSEMYKLFKDGSFSFSYSNGNIPTNLNPRNMEDCMIQVENCFLETGNTVSYFNSSDLKGVLNMIYALKGHSGDTIGYILLDGLGVYNILIAKNIMPIFYRELFPVFLERQNIVLKQKLEKSILDPLTGLKRRDALIKKAREILDRNSRLYEKKNSLESLDIISSTVAIIDIDDFKKVNDEYGHLVGDLVLQKITKIFKENSRQSDKWSWYRYGGEEFVGIFDSIPIEGAIACLNRIQKADKSVTLTERDNHKKVVVTMSIGVTSFTKEEIYFYSYIVTTLFKKLKKISLKNNFDSIAIIEGALDILGNIKLDFDINGRNLAEVLDIDEIFSSIIISVENIENVLSYNETKLVDKIHNIIKDVFVNAVIKRADDALYHSKNTGKDRITVY